MKEKIKTYEEFVKGFGKVYFEEIKPLIEMGNYEIAGGYLKNIAVAMKSQKDIFNLQNVSVFDPGVGLLVSINGMHQRLREGNFDPKRDFDGLEAYLAQTKLPTKNQINNSR